MSIPEKKITDSFFQGRLLVVSHKRHGRTAEREFEVSGGFPVLKKEFSRHVKIMRLCVPVRDVASSSQTIRYPDNVDVVPLPPYASRLQFFIKLPRMLWVIWREVRRADLVYAMCPGDMGLFAVGLARLAHKPFFVSIDTDRAGMTRLKHRETAMGRLWAAVVGKSINGFLKRFSGNVPAFITGDLFLGKRPHWRQWIKTTVTSQDILALDLRSTDSIANLNVIFVGRLMHEKNVECLIRAIGLLVQKGRKITLTIAGIGEERAALEALARDLAPDRVRFAGQVDNLELRRSRMLGADVLVLPSREERQGKVLLEAMACCVPVVAARAGGIPTVVTDQSTGLLFDPNSPEELADCLEKIAQNGKLRHSLVKNAYTFAVENTLDRTVSMIMEDVMKFHRFR